MLFRSTISGARNQLGELIGSPRTTGPLDDQHADTEALEINSAQDDAHQRGSDEPPGLPAVDQMGLAPSQLRAELLSIRALLTL